MFGKIVRRAPRPVEDEMREKRERIEPGSDG
jgi:hypothetical protein